MINKQYIITKSDVNKRLDIFLIDKFKKISSRTEIQKFIKNGLIKLNDKFTKSSTNLKLNDKININIDENSLNSNIQNQNLKPLNLPLNIVFENENLIIIDKQIGLTTHPGAGNRENTLVNVLLCYYDNTQLSNERGFDRIGIVHRLDKDTSGLMIIAKNNKSHRLLSEMIKNKEIERKYLALCYGIPKKPSGKIETYITRDKKNIKRMKICNSDESKTKKAITHYSIYKIINNNLSIIECKLETGRTHQIRLHMLYINNPIIGDTIYKKQKSEEFKDLNHQILHSYKIDFIEPITNKKISITSDFSTNPILKRYLFS